MTTLVLEQFGRELLRTGDLDPIYTMLARAPMERSQLQRWCVAYWCFYHAGVASYISELQGQKFWGQMIEAGENFMPSPLGGRWPRSAERRHFRGAACMRALCALADRYPRPEVLVEDIEQHAPSISAVRKQVLSLPLFGPWIAFKVADMLDRVLGKHVDFTEGDIFMFDSPSEAAEMWYDGSHEGGYGVSQSMKIRHALGHLQTELGALTAPPLNDRPLNLQEFETILCKWKSHVNGHYEVGKDIKEIREGLEHWASVAPVAAAMLEVELP